MNKRFERFSTKMSEWTGSVWAFVLAVVLVFGWLVTGPFFHFSTTHSLVINTITTIITFLMVFLIQNAQNKQTQAMNLKLDELIVSIDTAKDEFIAAEEQDAEWLAEHKITKEQEDGHAIQDEERQDSQ